MEAIHTRAPVIILMVITRNLKLVSVYTIFNMVIAGANGMLGIILGMLGQGVRAVVGIKNKYDGMNRNCKDWFEGKIIGDNGNPENCRDG